MTAADFLPAILAGPEDDTPRLVYADWLDENGQPERPEFIRVQCRLTAEFGDLDTACVCRASEDKFHCARCAAWDESEPLREVERRTFDRSHHEPEKSGWLTLPHTWALPGHYTGTSESQTAIVRRGFVDEVRLPLGAFVGTVEYADATTYAGGPDHIATLRTPGLAAELFAAHPITAVIATDRWPISTPIGGHYYWRRLEDIQRETSDDVDGAGLLPGVIFDRLAGGAENEPTVTDGNVRDRTYPTREAAIDALSAACVKYGRAAAKPNRAGALPDKEE